LALSGRYVDTESDNRLPAKKGFDTELAGRRAECDGGGPVGERYASREEFAGVLSGEYMDHGNPPSRWYLMKDLSRKPERYAFDTVWCEQGNIFLMDE
jgi:hypothetical protein